MDDGQVEDHRMRVAGLGTGLRIVLGAKVEAMEQLGSWMDTCWTLGWTLVGHLNGHLVDRSRIIIDWSTELGATWLRIILVVKNRCDDECVSPCPTLLPYLLCLSYHWSPISNVTRSDTSEFCTEPKQSLSADMAEF